MKSVRWVLAGLALAAGLTQGPARAEVWPAPLNGDIRAVLAGMREAARLTPAPAGRAAAASGADTDAYRIGDEWGKVPVTEDALARESAVFRRTAKATAEYALGTAFYLGKFNGRHIMATNYHVQRSPRCQGSARFRWLDRSFRCRTVYGSWKEIDLALFSIVVPAEDEATLAGLGKNFAYDAGIYPGQALLTIGFGKAGNFPEQGTLRAHMMAGQDRDCKVFSGVDEFRFLADPDNGVNYSAWSFASGCDVSSGDSGSAVVDRGTGELLGVIWNTKNPKPESIRSSAYLDRLLAERGPEIWSMLTYAVPAAKIREHIRGFLAEPPFGEPLDEDVILTLSEVIGPGGPAPQPGVLQNIIVQEMNAVRGRR